MSSHWKLDGKKATLNLAQVSGVLELARPGLGLQHLQLAGAAWEGVRLLGVTWGNAIDGGHTLTDCYLRGQDVIATYAEEAEQPFAPQLYWRASGAAAVEGWTPPQIELLVSVQTQLLDAEPRMTASTLLRASEVLYMEDAGGGPFEPLAPRRDAPAAACLLARLADRPWSYVEMIHPLDFVPGRLGVTQGGENVEIRHTLIACRMEKGVIIRVRLRGCIVPRAGDVQSAAALYEAFAGSALPLSA